MADRTAYIEHDVKLGELVEAWYDAQQRQYLASSRLATMKRVYGEDDRRISEQQEAFEEAFAAAQAAIGEVRAHEQGYTGWSRFFLVRNTNGHIHSSMECSTCYETTQFWALPQLSGMTEADAVEDQGMILCSVCFPSAPSEWTTGVSKATLAERAARQAEKDARAAQKRAKQLFDDGRTLKVAHYSLGTIASAKSWLTDWYDWNDGRAETDLHPAFQLDDLELVAAALAERLGETVEDTKAAAQTRAKKRRNR